MRIMTTLELAALPSDVWVVRVAVEWSRWDRLPPLLMCPACRLKLTDWVLGDNDNVEGAFVASPEHVEFMRSRHYFIRCTECDTPYVES